MKSLVEQMGSRRDLPLNHPRFVMLFEVERSHANGVDLFNIKMSRGWKKWG